MKKCGIPSIEIVMVRQERGLHFSFRLCPHQEADHAVPPICGNGKTSDKNIVRSMRYSLKNANEPMAN